MKVDRIRIHISITKRNFIARCDVFLLQLEQILWLNYQLFDTRKKKRERATCAPLLLYTLYTSDSRLIDDSFFTCRYITRQHVESASGITFLFNASSFVPHSTCSDSKSNYSKVR